MQTAAVRRAAVYIKEADGYHPEEKSNELQQHHCEESSTDHELESITRYHDPRYPV